MSQRWLTVPAGADPVLLVNATAAPETVALDRLTPGRCVIVRREDSVAANTVTIGVPTGWTLDGVTDATTTIDADSEMRFIAIDLGFQSYGSGSSAAEVSAAVAAEATARNAAIATQHATDLGTYARPSGAWSSATAYTGQEVVTYNGSTYRAVAASTNVTPGTDGTKWESWGGGGGLTGAAGSALTTSAQVAADPAMIQALPSTQYPMRGLAYKLTQQQAGGIAQVKWLTVGTSVADAKIKNVGSPLLQNAYGGSQTGAIIGSYGAPTGGSAVAVSGVTTNSTTGTAPTGRTADFNTWPSGLTIYFGATGSATYGLGGGSATCDHIEIYYVNAAASSLDGGTFSYKVDSGSTTNVDTSSGAGAGIGIGRVSLTPALGAHTTTIAWVSGNVRIIGVGFWNSTVNGVTWMNVAQGGVNLYQATAAAWTNFQTWLGWVAPDVITFEAKASQISSDGTDLSMMTAFLNAIDAASTDYAGPDVVIIGSTPDSQSQPELAVQDAIRGTLLPGYRPRLNVIGWDGYRPCGSYAAVAAMGWNGDGIHMGWQLSQFLAHLMARDLCLLNMQFAAKSGDVVGGTVVATTALKVGSKPSAIAATMTSDAGGNDITTTVVRGFKVVGPTANTLLDLEGAGAQNWIAGPLRIGSAGAQLVSTATTALSISQDGGTTNYADVNARSLTAALVGFGVKIREGSNARMGQSTLVGGTVTVSNTSVTANTRIFLTVATPGGTVGAPYVSTLTAGASFVITSTSGTDTSVVNWMLVEKI